MGGKYNNHPTLILHSMLHKTAQCYYGLPSLSIYLSLSLSLSLYLSRPLSGLLYEVMHHEQVKHSHVAFSLQNNIKRHDDTTGHSNDDLMELEEERKRKKINNVT